MKNILNYLMFIPKLMAKIILHTIGAVLWFLLMLIELLLSMRIVRYICLAVAVVSLIVLITSIIKLAGGTSLFNLPAAIVILLSLLTAAVGFGEFADLLCLLLPEPEDVSGVFSRIAKSFTLIDKTLKKDKPRKEKAKKSRRQSHDEQEDDNRQREDDRQRQNQSVSRESIIFFVGCNTTEELKTKYHALCKLYHPDMCGEDATAAMQAINDEYARMQIKLK